MTTPAGEILYITHDANRQPHYHIGDREVTENEWKAAEIEWQYTLPGRELHRLMTEIAGHLLRPILDLLRRFTA